MFWSTAFRYRYNAVYSGPEFPRTGPDWTGPKPVRGRGIFSVRVGSGNFFFSGPSGSGNFISGRSRLGYFFYRGMRHFFPGFRAYLRLYCILRLDLKLKSLISTQKIFHTLEFSGRFGSKLVHFWLMLNCFGPVRSGENIIGSVRGQGHKIYYFSVRSGSGQKITGQYGVGVPKTLPRRTLPGTSKYLL